MHSETWAADNGARYTLRPLQAQDAELLAGLLNGSLAGQSRFQRFHGTLGRLSAQRLQQLADADFVRHHAWVVTLEDAHGTRAVAEARFHVSADGQQAEFALATGDRWQRQGIGTRLMHRMLLAAHSHGLQRLHGEVLCHNTAMFALLRRCELACVPHPQEPGLMVAERHLPATPAARAARVVGAISAVNGKAVTTRAFDRCLDSLIGLRLALAATFSH
jgi:acetyltransferase